ncbi:MAG: biopolymer transporter ExbD [Bacteroidales bacterium]|nr:biopolymer transporter ExbD [Bacteroidales bacterium]
MAKFAKKTKGNAPAVSTASLPDIVFMLLFFFMVSTSMKEVTYKVQIKMPEASESKKIENKSLVSYIYVGPPTKAWENQYGTKPVIQLNDQIAKLENIAQWVEEERSARDEADVPKITFSLKVDQETEMGIVTDIKQELRLVQALKINYSAKRVVSK